MVSGMVLTDETVVVMVIKAVLFVVLLRFVFAILPSIAMPKPPASVRVVGDLEFAFGTCMALPSIVVLMFWPTAALGWKRILALAILAAVGVFWDILAIQLLKGKTWAMQVCVILSLVRVFTLIGTPFSVVSLYVLCQDATARSFFKNTGKLAREDQEKRG